MLQNRVDPFGNLIRTAARGSWMGNRGLIHNEQQQIVRSFKLKAWLICQLSFKGRHRQVMAPRLYTELFFLDEATAFAAGHRPCAECRRADFDKFKSCWIKGNPEFGFHLRTPIAEIDAVIHSERMQADGSKKTFSEIATALPEGTFIAVDGKAYLISHNRLNLWSAEGYIFPSEEVSTKWTSAAEPLPKQTLSTQAFTKAEKLTVLTPLSVVKAFKAGYLPQMKID